MAKESKQAGERRLKVRLFDPAIVGDALDFITSILESSTEYSVIGKDLQGLIVLWNEGARRIYGYEPGEVIGKLNAAALHSPAEVAAGRPREILDAALREGKWEGTIERVRKSGEPFTARVVVTPRRNPAGQPVGFLLISKDISQELRADRQLRIARQSLAGLVDSAMDAIVSVDEEQRIILFNFAAEEMFGRREDEVLGRSLDELIPARFRERHARHVRCFGDAGVTSRRMGALSAVSGLRKDGHEFPLEASISQHEVDGRTFFTAILRDITEREQAVQALRESEAKVRRLNAELERRVAERTSELEAANRELEAFDYSISHDLRAPINRIEGFSAILLEEFDAKLGDRGRELLQRIVASGQRMNQLVQDLLDLSTLTRTELRPAEIDLSAAARKILEGLAQSHPSRQVETVVAPGLVARGDPGLLRVVLENLLGNAWKFTSRRERARIEFGTAVAGGKRAYFVRDNGAGFDPAHAQRLFTPFHRLHAQKDFEGTGIGLATVQRIVSRHGGRAWAESPGEGATFHFTLGE
ncbi:MAG TPA: PAS domain S-box protein [Usitatibacter sp.]|nr:PAS domain S-box protein [Usitatibacter sp.]